MAEKKYDKEFEIVRKLLSKNKGMSISQAVKKACEKTQLQYHERIRKAINKRLVIKGEGKKEKDIPEDFKLAKQKTYDKRKKTFIITWAQNATPVHKQLWENILSYTNYLNANLHVIAGRYKNPTSVWSNKQDSDEWWSKEVKPYLDANRHNIHKYLQVLSDVKIQPTASTPLSGMNGITGEESCIVGHPRQHLKSLPVLEGYKHKLLLSTGSCTIPNYTDSKAGKKGEFHHMLGFIIVELDGDDFHIRQVNADDNGNFYDLFKRVKDGKVLENKEGCEAAVLGDIHVRHINKEASNITFKTLDFMKPNHTIIHDISESESILHWDEKDPFKLMFKEDAGLDNLEQELDEIIEWVKKHEKYNLVISRSNHDDMIDRWLKNTDWRKARNKSTYLKLANILAEEDPSQVKGILPILINKEFGEKVKTLTLDDSFRILDWELSMHGHLGSNGSRGSHTQFKNLNTKNITAHGHHPHREDGHIMVGTLSHLRVGFNRGASNWMNGFCLIYPDGKAQLIHIINGKICR